MTQTGTKEALRTTMNARDSAVYIGCSYWKFLEDIKAGRIPHFRSGNRVLCRKISLDTWMQQQEDMSVWQPDQKEAPGKIRRLK